MKRVARRLVMLGSLVFLGAAAACGGGDDSSGANAEADGGSGDATAIGDASTPLDGAIFVDAGDASPPDGGFLLAIDPAQINVDPGDTLVHVNVAIVRSGSFVDPITLSITTPAGVTASDPGTVSGALASFYLSIDADAGVTDAGAPDPVIQIVGHGGSKTASTSLSIHIGTILSIDGTSFVVPAGIDQVTLQAWGAGGAGGLQEANNAWQGNGGGGGYVTETISVVAGETLIISAGAVNTDGSVHPEGSGDYSSVARADGGLLLVAAGGGAGGTVDFGNNQAAFSGWPASAGGGLSGETPTWLSDAGCAGKQGVPGTQDGGGAFLGHGNSSSSSGGGGYYAGGNGQDDTANTHSCGGGGGSSWLSDPANGMTIGGEGHFVGGVGEPGYTFPTGMGGIINPYVGLAGSGRVIIRRVKSR